MWMFHKWLPGSGRQKSPVRTLRLSIWKGAKGSISVAFPLTILVVSSCRTGLYACALTFRQCAKCLELRTYAVFDSLFGSLLVTSEIDLHIIHILWLSITCFWFISSFCISLRSFHNWISCFPKRLSKERSRNVPNLTMRNFAVEKNFLCFVSI